MVMKTLAPMETSNMIMDNLILATVVLSGISGSSEQNYQTEILTYEKLKQKTLHILVGDLKCMDLLVGIQPSLTMM